MRALCPTTVANVAGLNFSAETWWVLIQSSRVVLSVVQDIGVESKGEQEPIVLHDDVLLSSAHDDGIRSAITCRHLGEHLSARATRRDRLDDPATRHSDDRDGHHGDIGILGIGVEYRRTLGTCPGRVSRILLIRTGDDLTIVEEYSGTDGEVRVRGISTLGYLQSLIDEELLLRGKLLICLDRNGDDDIFVHSPNDILSPRYSVWSIKITIF